MDIDHINATRSAIAWATILLFASIAIELLQLFTGLVAGTTFRIADINDVIFNTIGVAIGYVIFTGFERAYHRNFRNARFHLRPSVSQ